jgi:hypothetical protein
MSITQPECVCVFVALGIQHAMRVITSSVSCSALIFHIVIDGTIFEKKKIIGHKIMFRVSLQLLSETFCMLRIIERDMIKMYVGHHIQYQLFLTDFYET